MTKVLAGVESPVFILLATRYVMINIDFLLTSPFSGEGNEYRDMEDVPCSWSGHV